jgi:hypothetical protein
MSSPFPIIDPNQRRPDQIADAGTYRKNDPVWVWAPRTGQWRPGVVDTSSKLAVLVTFVLGPGGGTAVDSLLPRHVMPRDERDVGIDGGVTDPSLPRRPHTIRPTSTDTPIVV